MSLLKYADWQVSAGTVCWLLLCKQSITGLQVVALLSYLITCLLFAMPWPLTVTQCALSGGNAAPVSVLTWQFSNSCGISVPKRLR